MLTTKTRGVPNMSSNHDNRITLNILETSDLHGSILPHSYANHEPLEQGFAKLATLIRRERLQHEATLVIDNGDLIQGTPLVYHHARVDRETPNPMIRALNTLCVHAAVVGNHEFNYGLTYLQQAVNESSFPWLSANLLNEAGEPYFGKAFEIYELGGVKVGLIGLTTPYIPNWEKPEHITGIQFADPVAAARLYVKELREVHGSDVVIAAYHGGFERSLEDGRPTEPLTGENQGYELAYEVEGIDVLLTGHQHRRIARVLSNGVCIVQPGHNGKALGKVELTLTRADSDGRWTIEDRRAMLLEAVDAVPDSEVLALTEPYEAAAQQWLDQPMGTIRGDMLVHDAALLRLRDNPLIEFINRVQMELSGATISNTALFDNHSPGFPEQVTMRHVVSNYMYPNTLKVIRVSGQDIRQALEQTAEYFMLDERGRITVNPDFMEPKPQHYNYDMWEGIEYRLNVALPPGQRVVKLEKDGMPLDPEGQYDVVMNNYRAAGGGNYMMFQGKPVVADIPTDVSELIANYILQKGTIDAGCDGNWEVVTE